MGNVTIPDKTLNLRGIPCSEVLQKAQHFLEEMEEGMVLEVLSNDSCSCYDMPTWAKRTKGKKLLDCTQEEDGTTRLTIQKFSGC
jgi:TusA-related sulfurtransferase